MKRISALLLALALLLSLAACGGGEKSDDPNVGKWQAVSASMLGMEMEVAELFAGGVTLELKANGKFTIDVDGEKGNGKWAYEGDAIKFTASDADMEGSVKGGKLTLTNLLGLGMDITFEKEGGYAGAADTPAAQGDAGYYVIDSIVEAGEAFDAETLKALGVAYYILLNEDGTALINTDSQVNGTWVPGKLQYKEDGEDVVSPYALDKDMLTIELDGGNLKLVFKRSDGKPPAQAAQAPAQPAAASDLNALQQWWNGDWYGFIYLSTADGVWEELEEGFWDCFATVESDATGIGSIYLWDDGGELGNVALQISEHGVSSAGAAMSEGGSFNAEAIGHADWIIDPGTNTQPYEHLMIIDGTFEDSRGSDHGGFMYEIWLRPWGMLWDDTAEEDRPPGYTEWYLERHTSPMPSMSEFMSGTGFQTGTGSANSGGADAGSGAGSGGGSAQMTTADFDSFTVGYPAGTVLEDDWLNGRMIKDEEGRFEVQFSQQSSKEHVATVREEMKAYLSDPEAKGAVEFSRTIGGMDGAYCIKYDSIIWNEAMFSIAFPQPINGMYGVQLCVKAKNTKFKIDDVLALPQVQAILDSVKFKSAS